MGLPSYVLKCLRIGYMWDICALLIKKLSKWWCHRTYPIRRYLNSIWGRKIDPLRSPLQRNFISTSFPSFSIDLRPLLQCGNWVMFFFKNEVKLSWSQVLYYWCLNKEVFLSLDLDVLGHLKLFLKRLD